MARLGMALAFALVALSVLDVQAAELRVTCYSDGNECDVLRELSAQYTATHPATTVKVDQVPYKGLS